MSRKDPKTVREYLSYMPQPFRGWLTTVHRTVRKMSPHIEESIRYGIPTYSLERAPLIHFGAWRKHLSIYPATKLVKKRLKKELEPYEVENETLRIRWGMPIPVELIERMVKIRAEEQIGTPTIYTPWNTLERLREDYPELAPPIVERKGAAKSKSRAKKRRPRK